LKTQPSFILVLVQTNQNFCQIHGQKSGMKIWLNLEIKDISEQASLNVRDVSNIGHWGMGNIECVVKMNLIWLVNYPDSKSIWEIELNYA